MEPYDATHFNHNRCRPFLHEGGDRCVLLIHGFTGCVSHMRPLGDALADRGYTVCGINLPGHATTETDMAHTNWKQWLSASRDAAQSLKKRCRVLTVAGLSMGGVLALLLAQEGLADACVSLSAPMAARNRWIYLAELAAPFHPRVSWPPAENRHAALDAAFDYGYSGFPTAKAADLLHLIRSARRELQAVRCPLLVVQGTADRTIWPGSATRILQGATSGMKRECSLEGVPHVCTLSPALPQIVEEMDQLMRTL